MKTTLSMIWVFPPPSSSADVLPGLDGPGAWLTTDARESLLVQLVVRNSVFLDIGLHLFLGPQDKRVELDDVVRGVIFDRTP